MHRRETVSTTKGPSRQCFEPLSAVGLLGRLQRVRAPALTIVSIVVPKFEVAALLVRDSEVRLVPSLLIVPEEVLLLVVAQRVLAGAERDGLVEGGAVVYASERLDRRHVGAQARAHALDQLDMRGAAAPAPRPVPTWGPDA